MLRHATLENTSMSLKEKISRSAEAFVDLKAQNLPLQVRQRDENLWKVIFSYIKIVLLILDFCLKVFRQNILHV